MVNGKNMGQRAFQRLGPLPRPARAKIWIFWL